MDVPVSGNCSTSWDSDGLWDGAVGTVVVAVDGGINRIENGVVTGVRTANGVLTGSWWKGE